MQKTFLLLSILLLSFSSYAQNDSIAIKPQPGFTLFKGIMIEVGTAYLNDNSGLSPKYETKTGRPSTFNLYYLRQLRLAHDYLKLSLGLGLGLDNYYFKKDYKKSISTPDFDVSKYKLNANYVDIPLELQFSGSSNYKKAFKLAVGGKFGLLFQGKSKVKFEDGDNNYTTKLTNHDFRNYRYGITGRIGYGMLNIFGYYSLSNLFKDSFARDISPIIFGISFTSF